MDKWLNLFERSTWTFCQAFAASVVLTGNLGWGDTKIALGAAVLSVLKNLSIDTTVAGQLKVLSSLKTKKKGA